MKTLLSIVAAAMCAASAIAAASPAATQAWVVNYFKDKYGPETHSATESWVVDYFRTNNIITSIIEGKPFVFRTQLGHDSGIDEIKDTINAIIRALNRGEYKEKVSTVSIPFSATVGGKAYKIEPVSDEEGVSLNITEEDAIIGDALPFPIPVVSEGRLFSFGIAQDSEGITLDIHEDVEIAASDNPLMLQLPLTLTNGTDSFVISLVSDEYGDTIDIIKK